ncbi:ABC transporter substrate-binding protein [Yinghuangia sp. ASG 101]|uniref:ABC transporter substrate-binding protein n=1 Tax=Yinghuangia sp. ASG 101 TaxID=2896848 RepID=UPI001E5E3D4D|nr:ABC transporter substrate-binding protein [Yinghuangia sp. ASG 101]UGQ15142.1 ABC transporter substrate-binding protein [Yinghuangia sp. ASG 101]
MHTTRIPAARTRAAAGGPVLARRSVLGMLGLAALTACGTGGSGSGDGGTVTLDFLSYNHGTPDLGGQGTQKLIDAFHAANPDIRIRPQGVAVKDVLTKLRTDTAAGNPPDVAQIGWSKMAEAYESLPLVPVQDIAPEAEWRAHITGMSQGVLDAVRHDGKVKAMPYTMSIPVLFLNADLFRRAGLDPDNPPRTIAEVKDAALAVTSRTDAQGVYVAVADAGKSDYLTQSVVASNGGALVHPDGGLGLTDPATVGALTVLRDLTVSGAAPGVSANDAVAAFAGGKLAMIVLSTAALTNFEKAADGKFDLRTAPFPRFTDAPARPTYSGAGLAVLTKDEARRRAAWRFIAFLTGAQGFTIITRDMGYLPLRESLVTDPAYLAGYFAEDKRLLPALDQLGSVTPYTFFPGQRANQAVLALQEDAVEPIVLRKADPAKTLADTAAKIRSLVS